MQREGLVAASRRWLRPVPGWHVAGSLAVIAALSIALALDDWTLALVLLLSAAMGVALVLIVIGAGRRASRPRVRSGPRAGIIVAVVMGIWLIGLAGLVGLAMLASVFLHSFGAAPPPVQPVFKTYTVLVRHDASNPDAFTLDISVSTVEGGIVQLGRRRVTSVSATGFLARQVVMPGPGRYSAPVAGSATENLCQGICPDVNVRFEDFPVDSVWEVQRGKIDEHLVSGDTEVVTASIVGIDIGMDDIEFTYFPAPYNAWRPYLGPIPGASSLPVLLVAILGTVLSGTWVLAMSSFEGAAVRSALHWLRRKDGAAEPVEQNVESPSEAEPAHLARTSALRRGRPRH